MAQHVGIAIGRRDFEVVKISPDGSAWSRHASPNVPANASSDADSSRRLVDVFAGGLSKAGDRVDAANADPADVRAADVNGVQQRLGTDASISVGTRNLSPAEVTTLILAELLGSLGVTGTTYGMIAVPSDFDQPQRDAIETVVERLNVDVLDVVDRPDAAAYVGGPPEPYDRVCVYEYGDAFRATLLDTEEGTVDHVASTEGRHPTRATFDAVLGRHLVAEYVDGDPDVPSVGRSPPVRRVANRVRTELRTEGIVNVERSDVPNLKVPVVVDPEMVANATMDVVETTLTETDALFDEPDVAVLPWQVDALVLTGDVARVPPVADAVSNLFEAEVVDPEWTRHPTAAGAALATIDDAPIDRVSDDVLTDEEDAEADDALTDTEISTSIEHQSDNSPQGAHTGDNSVASLFFPAALPFVGALASLVGKPTPVVELADATDGSTDHADRGLSGFLLTVTCSFLIYLLFAFAVGLTTTFTPEVLLAVVAVSVTVSATVVGFWTMTREAVTRGSVVRAPKDAVDAEEVVEPGFASWLLAIGAITVALFAVPVTRGVRFGGLFWTIKVLVFGAVAIVIAFLFGAFLGAFVGAFLGLADEGATVGGTIGVIVAVLQTLDWATSQPEYGALWVSHVSLGPVRVDVLANLLLGIVVPVGVGLTLLTGLLVVAIRPFVDRYERGYAVNPINWTISLVIPFLAAVFVTLDGHAAVTVPGVTLGRAELWLACLATPPLVGLAYGLRRYIEYRARA